MSDEEIRLQAQLQLQQMQSNLEQSERELAQARREVEEHRRLIISLGQAFVPDVFAARAASGNSKTLPQIKAMKTGEIVGLIVQALGQRLSKLTAFTQGLTAEQQTQVLKHLFEKASSDWLDDPRFGEARRAVATAQLAQRQAEQAAHDANERADRMNVAQETSAREALRLRGEIRDLQEQTARELARLREENRALQAAMATGNPVQGAQLPLALNVPPTLAQPREEPARSAPLIVVPPLVPSAPASFPRTNPSDSTLRSPTTEPLPTLTRSVPVAVAPTAPTASPLTVGVPASAVNRTAPPPVPAQGMDALIMVMATRGVCERARIAEVMDCEYGVSEDVSIRAAFTDAQKAEYIRRRDVRNETGYGQPPLLYDLTDKGQAYASQVLHVELQPSELDRLTKRHDTLEHVALILQTRSLFEEKYPAPVERVDLYPAPVLLNEGKSSEPDLVVTLRDGTQMLIECERETKKDEKKRRDKWAKYFQATRGEFYIVGSNSKAVSALNSEITTWHMGHGGEVHLHLTSILQAHQDPKFWVLDRELGKSQEHRR